MLPLAKNFSRITFPLTYYYPEGVKSSHYGLRLLRCLFYISPSHVPGKRTETKARFKMHFYDAQRNGIKFCGDAICVEKQLEDGKKKKNIIPTVFLVNVRSFVLRSCSESKWLWRRWCCKVFFTSRQATSCTKTVALTCSLALLVHNQLRSQGNQAMYRGRKKQNELYNIWNISAKSSNYNIMIDLSLRVSSLESWCSVVSKILWCAIFVVFF